MLPPGCSTLWKHSTINSELQPSSSPDHVKELLSTAYCSLFSLSGLSVTPCHIQPAVLKSKVRTVVTMDTNSEKEGYCAFDTLFTNNVPHLLERIFLSLDYTSFKTCLKVKSDWNGLLTSESFQRRAKALFRKEISDDEKSLQHGSRKGKANEVRSRADKKSQVRQCLGFCTADIWSSFAYKSAEQKSNHCLA